MSAASSETPEFTGWRAFLWPVHNYELKKLIPMLGIFFLISFCYNILRTLKDPLVMHSAGSGAEVIPFIKVWVMFPGAVIMTFLFTRLSNRLSRERVFYLMTSFFLAYFVVYVCLIYPNNQSLHLNSFADYLQTVLPVGFKGFISMIRNWTETSFYVMAELWGNIVLFVLFWGFANQTTRLTEAKRFYGLFGIGANLSGFFSGQFGVILAKGAYASILPFGATAWEQSLFLQVGAVTVSGILALILFYWFNRVVLTDERFKPLEDQSLNANGEKVRFSMRDNISTLFRSSYIMFIAIIMIAYNLVINLVEVLWKHEVKELYPQANDYNIYMNEVSSLIGVIATLTALFISGNAIRKCGWTFTAMLTPVILFVTSIGFFGFFFLKEYGSDMLMISLTMSPLAIVVFFGSAQNVLSRASKYSVFDATREMAFIPLQNDEKVKAKAAIDGVCSRLGKSGGALIHQSLLLAFGSLTVTAPYVAAFLLTTIGIWAVATYLLGQQFNKRTTQSPASFVKPVHESTGALHIDKPLELKQSQAV